MQRIIFFSLIIPLFLACTEKAQPPIPPAVMQDVLREIHYADAAAERFEAKLQPRTSLREDLYDRIMERFGLTRQEFFDSYRYYIEETTILDSLYQDMIDTFDFKIIALEDSMSLERQRLQLYNQQKLEKMGDSLKSGQAAGKTAAPRPVWQQQPQ